MTVGTYYDAWSGRFTSEDIIKGNAAYPETLNAYGYCWGNPLKFVDRDGNWPEWIDVSEDGAKEKIKDNKENIKKAAEEAGVDPALVAMVIYTEQANNVNIVDAFTDVPGAVNGVDTSIGLGQVRVSTANEIESKGYMPKIETKTGPWYLPFLIINFERDVERSQRINMLVEDATNIRYVAAYIALIEDTWKKEFPDIYNRPDIIWTLYNIGYDTREAYSSPQPGELADFAKDNYELMKCLLE